MRTLRLFALAAATALPMQVDADKFDLAQMKCKQFVQTSSEQASVITAWLVGYYTEPTETEVVDVGRVKDTGTRLATFCAANPNFAVGSAAEGLLGK
jgi:hypothetical protein